MRYHLQITSKSLCQRRYQQNVAAEWLATPAFCSVDADLDAAPRPAILTEVFHNFPQPLQANAEIVQGRPRPLPFTSFAIHNLLQNL